MPSRKPRADASPQRGEVGPDAGGRADHREAARRAGVLRFLNAHACQLITGRSHFL